MLTLKSCMMMDSSDFDAVRQSPSPPLLGGEEGLQVWVFCPESSCCLPDGACLNGGLNLGIDHGKLFVQPGEMRRERSLNPRGSGWQTLRFHREQFDELMPTQHQGFQLAKGLRLRGARRR